MANDIPTNLRVPTQLHLDAKTYIRDETLLQDLGVDDNLAYTYPKGLEVTCIMDRTKWEWKEMEDGDIGLLSSNFVYPNPWIVDEIDYSNKEYNFVEIKHPVVELPPLKIIDDFLGTIVIRNRIDNDYSDYGFNSINLSLVDYEDDEDPYGVQSDNSSILGGKFHRIKQIAHNSVIAGGFRQTIESIYSGIASGSNGFIGRFNDASFIGGGSGNEIVQGISNAGGHNVIGGGGNNILDGYYSIIGAGQNNKIKETSQYAGIFTGYINELLGNYSFIGGGNNNKTFRTNCAILGGARNQAYGGASMIIGTGLITGSYGEIALGEAGTDFTGGSLTAYNINNRALNVGIGNFVSNIFKDGFSIFKNGSVLAPELSTAIIEASANRVLITKEYLNSKLDGSDTKITNSTTITTSGSGTIASPYKLDLLNPQKEITSDYILQAEDFNQTLFLNNSVPITITIPTSGLPANFCVGLIHETDFDVSYTGSGVSNPVGLKSKGEGYQQFIERKLNTSTYYLLGNTKA